MWQIWYGNYIYILVSNFTSVHTNRSNRGQSIQRELFTWKIHVLKTLRIICAWNIHTIESHLHWWWSGCDQAPLPGGGATQRSDEGARQFYNMASVGWPC